MEAWRRELYRRKRGYVPSELYHYGVSKRDGAKVGSGRYPLGSGERPRSEKNYFDKVIDKAKARNRVEVAAHITAGIAAVAALALATGYVIPHAAVIGMAISSGVINSGKSAIRNLKHLKLKSALKQIKQDGDELPKKTEKTTPEEDEKAVNPFYSTGKDVYTQNCAQCSLAYDMRRKGYDVSAIPTTKGMTKDEIALMYKDSKKAMKKAENSSLKNMQNIQDKEMRRNEIKKWFNSFKEDGRYNLCVFTYGYGHSIIFEIEKGKQIIRNTQSGDNMTVESFVNSNYALRMNNFTAIRIDNLKIDETNAKRMVEPAWKKKGT